MFSKQKFAQRIFELRKQHKEKQVPKIISRNGFMLGREFKKGIRIDDKKMNGTRKNKGIWAKPLASVETPSVRSSVDERPPLPRKSPRSVSTTTSPPTTFSASATTPGAGWSGGRRNHNERKHILWISHKHPALNL